MRTQIDLTGKQFNKLTVISRVEKPENIKSFDTYWLCRCECGVEKIVSKGNLVSGSTKSCGCWRSSTTHEYPHEDMTGQKFGKLTVILYAGKSTRKDRSSRWVCKCECVGEKVATRLDLLNGYVKSCGCNGAGVANYIGEVAVENAQYGIYQRSAKHRGISFDLTKEEFISIIHQPCHYDGFMDRKNTQWGNERFEINGIDRLDPTKGYTMDNCVPCCKNCNYAKRSMSDEEFTSWIQRLINFNKDR